MKKYPISRFLQALYYLLGIHAAALLFFFVFRLILFCSIDYDFSDEIQGDWLLQATAFIKGLWFDNVIGCYILILPLVVMWIAALFNYTAYGYICSQEVGSSVSIPCRSSSVRPTYLILNTFSKLSILPSSIGLDMQGLPPV